MQTQPTPNQPVKKLTLKKQYIGLLTPQLSEGPAAGPTAIDCSITC